MNIYEFATTDTPVVDLFCWNEWPASTIFRHTTTETTTSTTASQSTPTPAATLTTPFSPATPSATTSPSTSTEEQESESWIAGAVIGPVAGCALIGALGFWLVRRNRNKKNFYVQEAQHMTGSYASGTKISRDIGPSPNELPGDSVQSEPLELESHHRQ
ncbi:uncharacterized protein N7500_001838 [Penicillium coprophilum]|uniref:uncharacterized protein n=1 Tax=Penicillium coprophilum TaxID=36646 RepID=UPI002394FC7D|nr:uncharacterized protein N7500_001838 [Penicillium coprophilum]KAJ5173907.1 hypothetical protein N7500_001838 [Penicillium coprophilum]